MEMIQSTGKKQMKPSFGRSHDNQTSVYSKASKTHTCK
jgi:hypothetical protein